MSDKSKIEWTDATWNPIRGCSRVSEGCRNCYAERQAARFSGPGQPYEGLVTLEREPGDESKGDPRWTGAVRFVPEALEQPLHWKRPRRIFVNSMSDLFHERVEERWINQIIGVMRECPQHTFQILTKRAKEMSKWTLFKMLPNVWLGVSVEGQKTADERIPLLLQTPAAVRWVSYEPALWPVDFARTTPCGYYCNELWGHIGHGPHGNVGNIDWIVAGGESGPHARPSDPKWFRSVRDQCQAAGVPFFFKQWGEWIPVDQYVETGNTRLYRGMNAHGRRFLRVGKKRAGHLLDGQEWQQFPKGLNA